MKKLVLLLVVLQLLFSGVTANTIFKPMGISFSNMSKKELLEQYYKETKLDRSLFLINKSNQQAVRGIKQRLQNVINYAQVSNQTVRVELLKSQMAKLPMLAKSLTINQGKAKQNLTDHFLDNVSKKDLLKVNKWYLTTLGKKISKAEFDYIANSSANKTAKPIDNANHLSQKRIMILSHISKSARMFDSAYRAAIPVALTTAKLLDNHLDNKQIEERVSTILSQALFQLEF